jgi:hypothetical protein
MAEGQAAYDAFKSGHVTEGLLKSIASVVPAVGPWADTQIQRIRNGEGPEVAADISAAIIGGKLVSSALGAKVPSMRSGMNPNEARAIDAARAEGVPVSAGVATGNRPIAGMTQMAEKTSATGATAANRAREATAAGLENMGRGLADQSSTGPAMTMGQGGQAAADALKRNITTQSAKADTAYTAVRAAEKAGTVPPVNFKPVMDLLQPIRDHLDALNTATAGLAADTAPGATKAALDTLGKVLDAPLQSGTNTIPVSLTAAENVLSNLKEGLRSQSNQFGVGAGQLKLTIKALQGEIDKAAQADPAAWQALQDGRAATTQKYQAAKLYDKVAGKDQMRAPETAAEQLLSPAGTVQLKRLAVQSPQSVDNLARAWFEDRFTQAASKDGFNLTKASADWRSMSPETKQVAFKSAIAKDPNYLQKVDDFFLAARKIQENQNPSGTGAAAANYIKMATLPITAAYAPHVAAGVLAEDLMANGFARAMNNPRVVSLLIDGLKLPTNAVAARAGNIAQIQALLRATPGGIGPALVPATAGSTPTTPSGRGGGSQ